MTFKDDQQGGLVIDTSLPIANIVMVGLAVIGWVVYGVRVDDQIKDNTVDISEVSQDHLTDWASLTSDVDELDDDYNAQAVSIGIIQTTVEANQRTLSNISVQINELSK